MLLILDYALFKYIIFYKWNHRDHGLGVVYLQLAFVVLTLATPKDGLKPRKGIRWGDPLSPFSFYYRGSKLMIKVMNKDLLESCQADRRHIKVSLVQFKNHTIYFCRTKTKGNYNVNFILLVLRGFLSLREIHLKVIFPTLLSSLIISTDKLHIGYIIVNWATSYLGLPLGGTTKHLAKESSIREYL